MTPVIWIGATTTLLSCGLCLCFSHLSKTQAAGVFKTLASLSFLSLAWVLGLWSHHPWLVVALLLSFTGDVLLVQKGRGWGFKIGLVSFLLAHLAFLIQFFIWQPERWSLFFSVMVALTLATMVWLIYLKPRIQSQQPAILTYLCVIALMVGTAGGLVVKSPWLLLGAALFAASDVFVVRQRFIKPDPINRLVGLPMYYLAQLILIVASDVML